MSLLRPAPLADLRLFPLASPYHEIPAFYADVAKHHQIPTAEECVKRLLFCPASVPTFCGNKRALNDYRSLPWLPSSCWGTGQLGPVCTYDTMVVGKMPMPLDHDRSRNFAGESGRLLYEVVLAAGMNGHGWYLSNAIRFFPADGGKKLSQEHLDICGYLLAQDIALTRPRNLLVLGADAVHALFGKHAKLSELRSRPLLWNGVAAFRTPPQAYTDASSTELEAYYRGVKVVCTVNPASVLREPGLRDGFVRDIELFKRLTNNEVRDRPATTYVAVDTPVQLEAALAQAVKEQLGLVALDCEWGFGNFARGTLRTVQLCWRPGFALIIVLARKGGAEAQSGPERAQMLQQLSAFIQRPDVKLVGHNMRADAMWLEDAGIPVLRKTVFDTMLADHILSENAEHDLEALSVRYTSIGRYEGPLVEWLKANGMGRAAVKRRGYIDVPDELLYPYAAIDVDVTFQAAFPLSAALGCPENAGPARCYYGVVMPAQQALSEMERTGLLADRTLITELAVAYEDKKQELLDLVRTAVQRPQFNPDSTPQKQALLFGAPDEGGLGLRPYKTTGKPSRMWDELDEAEQERYSPSTDAETMEALSGEHFVISKLHDFATLNQLTKQFLRLPRPGEDEDDERGLLGAIDPDGRVRTSLLQTSETGREKSRDPNMQNLPSKQEKAFERIMGEGSKVPPIRSGFMAPKGSLIVAADLRSAEIFTMGFLSNCMRLVEEAKSDLHARAAVNYFKVEPWEGFDAFKLPPESWKKQYKAERIGAKTVNFGIPYQRGAAAVARQIARETKGGLMLSREDTQTFIDNFYQTYPEMRAYVDVCKASVTKSPHHLENPFGRRRRFSARVEKGELAAQEREAVNFPIQSTVADVMNTAFNRLWMWRLSNPGMAVYKILLTVHDSVLLEVPGPYVPVVIERVLPECMSQVRVPCWRPLHGNWTSQEFSLDIDIEVGKRWGVDPTREELREAGVPSDWIDRLAKAEHAA